MPCRQARRQAASSGMKAGSASRYGVARMDVERFAAMAGFSVAMVSTGTLLHRSAGSCARVSGPPGGRNRLLRAKFRGGREAQILARNRAADLLIYPHEHADVAGMGRHGGNARLGGSGSNT